MTGPWSGGDGIDGPEAAAGGSTRRTGRRAPGSSAGRGRGAGRSSFGEGGRGRGAGTRTSRSSEADDAGGTPAAPDDRDPAEVARGICLRALTGAAKTRQQLAELLKKNEIADDVAEGVLDRLTEVNLIDDAAFAAAWVQSRQAGRGLARRALTQELRSKGIDDEVAAAAVAAVDPQDEWDTARALVERRARSMAGLDRVTAERRLVGMLARKGYGGGLAGIVAREALDAVHADAAALDDPDEEAAQRSIGTPVVALPAAPADASADEDDDEVLVTNPRASRGGFGDRSKGRGLGGGFGSGSSGGRGGFGGGGLGGRPSARKASRTSASSKPNGGGLGGGGGIAGQRAAEMADEVGEGHGVPLGRRSSTPD